MIFIKNRITQPPYPIENSLLGVLIPNPDLARLGFIPKAPPSALSMLRKSSSILPKALSARMDRISAKI